MTLPFPVPLAHQGEEVLIPMIPALVFLFVYWLRARKSAGGEPEALDRCPYCGADLAEGAERCERCGFKVAR
jgi:hypothetical protein